MAIRSVLQKSLLAGVILAVAGPAFADVTASVEAWSRGNYSRAIDEWKGPAERGDVDAFNIGQAYRLSRWVQMDLVKAEDLFAKPRSPRASAGLRELRPAPVPARRSCACDAL
jgi:hypothetical protein